MFELGRRPSDAVDHHAPTSLHAQISDAIRATIVAGTWPPHFKLSPEPELAEQLGVSRGTLRRAITTLVEEGLLKQVRGRGTFVTENLLEPSAAQKLSTLSEDFASQHVSLETRVISVQLVIPPPGIASLLQLPDGTRALRLVRIRSTEGRPIALLHNYVRSDLVPGLEDADFTTTTLFGALEGQFGVKIGTARRSFSAQAATDEVAESLGLKRQSPVQYLEQLTFLADGGPIEYSDVWINSQELRVVTLLARR